MYRLPRLIKHFVHFDTSFVLLDMFFFLIVSVSPLDHSENDSYFY